METMRLNAICPYFTTFPLVFPYKAIAENAMLDTYVLASFYGRGTANLAA